jgi:hypothetical protein
MLPEPALMNIQAYKTVSHVRVSVPSQASIFEAMQTRSTYATTGHRAYMNFRAVDGGPIAMGEEYIAENPTFRWVYYPQDNVQYADLLSVEIDTTGTSYTVKRLERWVSYGRRRRRQPHLGLGWNADGGLAARRRGQRP